MNALYITLIVILILLSGFFSLSDMVFSSVNKRSLERKSEKSKAAKLALKLASDYDRTIVVILFGNTLVNILSASLATVLANSLFPHSGGMAELAVSGIMLVIILIFGEILPKAIGRNYSSSLAPFIAYPVRFFSFVFYPFVIISGFFATHMSKPIIKKAEDEEEHVPSDEELQVMVEEMDEAGIIDDGQSELLSRSIDFKETAAFEIMTPRVDIEAIDINENLDEYQSKEGLFKHSRIPVYEETVDHIVGYIPVKALLRAKLGDKPYDIKSLMLPVIYVPRTMVISSVLEQMKKSKHHIAAVIDEYGGTEGIVTLEDILEELVGEMWDESEAIDDMIVSTGKKNVFSVKGNMDIEEFFERFELDPDYIDDDYQTVSGWIIDRLEKFAAIGDSFKYAKVDIKVVEATQYRVERVEVVYHPRRKKTHE